MPTSVAVAIGADLIGTAIADAVIFDLAAATTLDWVASYAVIQAGSSFLVGAALRSALADSSDSAPSFAAQSQLRAHVIRSALANRQIVYGRVKVSGPLVFAASSADNNTLHLVVAIAGHEIDAVEEVYLNDELATDAQFSGYVTTAAHLGAPDQVADVDLVAAGVGWTSEHRLRGVAYLYVKLTYSRDVFPRGIPNISAVIRGKKLYDPRTGATVWSQNLALAVRDYLVANYGLAATPDEIDDAALIAAANICDETVPLADATTEARYTANGVLDIGNTPRANMEALLSGCGGALTWPDGRWTLHVGGYEAPVITLDQDDLAGPVQVRARVARQELFNAIKGTFVDPAQGWQPVDFPSITNATYAAQDGAQIFRDVAFQVTTSAATAQRLAKMMVEKSRQGITVQAPFKLAAFKLSAWDNVRLSLPSMGWSAKVFKVTGWAFNEIGNINLTLQEEAAACYTWSAEETRADPAPDTNLPAWNAVAAPGAPDVAETLFQTTGSAGVKARATMSWAASPDALVLDYLPEYRIANGTWIVLPATGGLAVEINDIAPGDYEFRLRARNALGVRSAYSGSTAKEILGLTAAPTPISDFAVQKIGGLAVASWHLAEDLDVRVGGRIVIRHSSLTSGATWSDGIILDEVNGDAVSALLPLMSGTYMVKSVDSSGNYATSIGSFVATEGMVTGYTTVATRTEAPTFSGAKTNCVVVSGALQLDSAAQWDSYPGNLDDWPYIDTLGVLASAGEYLFSSHVDMTTVATRRLESAIAAISIDTGDLMDSRAVSIDDWSDFDGSVVNDTDLTLYVATTDTDPAGSPTWTPWLPFFVADVTCRAMKFKALLTSANSSHQIAVSTLTVKVKS